MDTAFGFFAGIGVMVFFCQIGAAILRYVSEKFIYNEEKDEDDIILDINESAMKRAVMKVNLFFNDEETLENEEIIYIRTTKYCKGIGDDIILGHGENHYIAYKEVYDETGYEISVSDFDFI